MSQNQVVRSYSKTLRPKCVNQQVSMFSLRPSTPINPVGFAPNPSRRAEKDEGWIRAGDAHVQFPKLWHGLSLLSLSLKTYTKPFSVRMSTYNNSDLPEVAFPSSDASEVPPGYSKPSEPAVSEKCSVCKDRQIPCGLSLTAFACLVALLAGTIVGAAVGGGLGGSLAHERDQNRYIGTQSVHVRCPLTFLSRALRAATSSLAQRPVSVSSCLTLSPSSTTASASASSSPTAGLINYAPASPPNISTVALNCPAVDNTQYITARGQTFLTHCGVGLYSLDLASILAYRFEDCIEACSSMNHYSGNATYCNAMIFSALIDGDYSTKHANCWLKYAENITGSNEQYTISAQLTNNGSGLIDPCDGC